MMKPLPSGPGEMLFQRASLLINEFERYGGASDPFRTLGGGTVLMFPPAWNDEARPSAGRSRLRGGPLSYRLFA